jgi:hypothetical protein
MDSGARPLAGVSGMTWGGGSLEVFYTPWRDLIAVISRERGNPVFVRDGFRLTPAQRARPE